MIKDFNTYINEDYFSKLANRKDKGEVRKENEITEEFVRSFILKGYESKVNSVTIRRKNNKPVVDIDGDFFLVENIEEIPFQFGTVSGEFNCSRSTLTSLIGCPEIVGEPFDISDCAKLKSLEGCPKTVGGNFYCYGCCKHFTEKEVKSLCCVGGGVFV